MTADISYVSYYEKFPLSGEVKCIDEEIPFEIPNGWVWARISNIFQINPKNICSDELEVAFIPMEKLSAGYGSNYSYEKVKWRKIKKSFTHFANGDIAFAKITPCFQNRKSAVFEKLPNGVGAGTTELKILRTFAETINRYYLLYFLKSPYFVEEAIFKGTANQQRIISGYLENKLFPLPPLEEQQRIVEKIKELIPHIEYYSKAQTELDVLNKNIKEELKKSVLQYAIEGKLVPQDEAEDTAEELLLQIQAEKLKLYKENKLKKKDLEYSTIFKDEDNKYYEKIGKNVTCIDEEIPFEIPNGWVWARGTTLFLPMESTKPQEENFTYIDLDAVNNKKNNIDNPKILKSTNAPSRASRKLHTNDVLYSMVRPYLRNIALVDKKFSNAIASTGFYVITPSIALNPHFLFRLMLSSYVTDGLNLFMKGENSPSINNSHIEDFLYPLPPLAEQQRIVESIEAIFRCIERD